LLVSELLLLLLLFITQAVIDYSYEGSWSNGL